MKLFVIFTVVAVITPFVRLTNANCDNWRIYKNHNDIQKNGIEVGRTEDDIPTYVGRASVGGIFVPGYIQGDFFYAYQDMGMKKVTRGFQYLVADNKINNYDWVELTTQDCVPDAVFVSNFMIGRNVEDSHFVGYITGKYLHHATNKGTMVADNYETLTCKPKPCTGGGDVTKCKESLTGMTNEKNKCEGDKKSLQEVVSKVSMELENSNKSLEASIRDFKTCKIEYATSEIEKKESEARLLKGIEVLKADNERLKTLLNECKSNQSTCAPKVETTTRPYVATTTQPRVETTTRPSTIIPLGRELTLNEKFDACMEYIKDDRRSFSRIKNITEEIQKIKKKFFPTVEPFYRPSP